MSEVVLHGFLKRGTPALVLAPMEGVTDYPMRVFQGESGAFQYGVCEFIRVSQEPPPPKVFHRYVPELQRPSRLPVQVQLLGGDPEKMAKSALIAIQSGATGIDINFGCPAPTVNRHDGGATLLKYPCRIEAIVKAVRTAVPKNIPVSAKLRLGWDSPDAIHENAEKVEAAGADWITIHGRTKIQGYAPPALWVPIGEVQRRLSIPVVANGDIWTREDFLRCQEVTGCEHFMLGRSALANPWLSRELASLLGLRLAGEPEWYGQGVCGEKSDWLPVLRRFTELALPFFTHPGYVARRLKQWLKMAANRGMFQEFEAVKRIETLEEVLAWLHRETADRRKGDPI